MAEEVPPPQEEQDEFQRPAVDQASAARTIEELEAEIETLKELEALAYKVRNSGVDRKWEELSKLLQNNSEMFDANGYRRKLIVFHGICRHTQLFIRKN